MLLILLTAASAQQPLVDVRDGARYRVAEIGRLKWMAENLRYGALGSVCYGGNPKKCEELGRLYDHEAALAACPAGWRLPSDEDWAGLEAALGMKPDEIAKDRGRGDGLGDRLKAGGDTGFHALLAGYYDPHDKEFKHEGRTAAFWASTLDGQDDVSALAWHRDVDMRRSTIWRSKVNVTYKLPVRCVSG
jgi:uncharacterized protein (TIGR02145 family)